MSATATRKNDGSASDQKRCGNNAYGDARYRRHHLTALEGLHVGLGSFAGLRGRTPTPGPPTSKQPTAHTAQAFETSLRRLGLDYVDQYLIHQPFGDYYGEWRVMEELHAQGLARAIGVANFYPDRLADLILHNQIVPAVNQIETHPFFQRQADQDFMTERGVQIESWGQFAEGRNNLFSDPTLTGIAGAHGKSVAQVVLRWLTQRGVIVIPRSVSKDRMAQNMDIFDFELTPDQMAAIAKMDTGASLFFDHRDPDAVIRLGSRTVD